MEILLWGLWAETLVLIGALTDACVQYTFADGHQCDFRMRVAQDAVIGSGRAAHNASLAAFGYLRSGTRRNTMDLVAAWAVQFIASDVHHYDRRPLDVGL